jgi:hypothetical protein
MRHAGPFVRRFHALPASPALGERGLFSGGGAEWIDRWVADEVAQDLADCVSLQLQPVQDDDGGRP